MHTRRSFLGKAMYRGSGLILLGCSKRVYGQPSSRPRRISANEKIGVAGIGAGGQGKWDILGAKPLRWGHSQR